MLHTRAPVGNACPVLGPGDVLHKHNRYCTSKQGVLATLHAAQAFHSPCWPLQCAHACMQTCVVASAIAAVCCWCCCRASSARLAAACLAGGRAHATVWRWEWGSGLRFTPLTHHSCWVLCVPLQVWHASLMQRAQLQPCSAHEGCTLGVTCAGALV